jgi:hypothetical protein
MLYIEESKLLQVLEVLTVWSDASTTQKGKDAIKVIMDVLETDPVVPSGGFISVKTYETLFGNPEKVTRIAGGYKIELTEDQKESLKADVSFIPGRKGKE